MYDSPIINCSSFNDVFPGDPWMPEPAARYNAVNELLRQESNWTASGITPGENNCVLNVINVSDQDLIQYRPVQLGWELTPPNKQINERDPFTVYGKNVDDRCAFWGVALESIKPGKCGPVQISGVAYMDGVEGNGEVTTPWNGEKVKNTRIYAGLEGPRIGPFGRAEVLFWDDSWTYRKAVVYLGEDNTYTGPFAVLDNGNRTVTVKGGETDLGTVEDAVLSFTSFPTISVVARREGSQWNLSIELAAGDGVPGESMVWPLARVMIGRYMHYFWQGYKINFGERYYVY